MITEAQKQISKRASDRMVAGYWEYKRRNSFQLKIELATRQLDYNIRITRVEIKALKAS